MKKIVFIVISALWLTGCASTMFWTAADFAEKARMGMTVEEFEKMTDGRARVFDRTLHGITFSMEEYGGDGEYRWVSGYKLFHFSTERRLYRIETRRLQPVYRPRGETQQRPIWD